MDCSIEERPSSRRALSGSPGHPVAADATKAMGGAEMLANDVVSNVPDITSTDVTKQEPRKNVGYAFRDQPGKRRLKRSRTSYWGSVKTWSSGPSCIPLLSR